jgi:site-specific recombinase XerC
LKKYNPVEAWINNVSASHSDSIRTRQGYLLVFKRFCEFISKSPKQIFHEFEATTDRKFRRQYAEYVRAFIASEQRRGIAPSTISSRVGIIKSFFKYNDLPLGFVPTVKARILYRNRDITHKEVKLILGASRPRERAFYAIMAQSGLRPDTICNLKYKHIKEDLENDRIPCKIEIPQEIAKGKYHSYFTFIGEEAVKYLRSYLIIRSEIKDEEYLFVKEGTESARVNPKSFSKFFAQTVQKLNEKGLMKLNQKKSNKPHDIRLYNLRKWFRKYANQAGFEFVQFWMGHTVKAGQDEHYRPPDLEYYRKIYAEKAMPFLRLETATPTEAEKAITTLKQENKELKEQIENLETTMHKIYQKVFHEEIEREKIDKSLEKHMRESSQWMEDYDEMRRKEEEYLEKHPEERKRREEQAQKQEAEFMKYLEEHAEEIEEQEKWIEEQRIREDERRKTLRELQDTFKKAKKMKK